jgi:hypothetical protein
MSASWQAPDFDEIRPDRFIINNDKVRPLLKGEGVTVGKFFELVTWRREGLIGRIRERGFNVRTLADRVAALGSVSAVAPRGEESLRVLHHPKERIAIFDRQQLHWSDLTPFMHDGKPTLRLAANIAVRRRKGRGHADYYLTAPSGTQSQLIPTKELKAMLHAYSQITQEGPPVILLYKQADEGFTILRRQALLPAPHQEVLDMLSLPKTEPWTIPASAFELAHAVFAKLAIQLQLHASSFHSAE